MLTLKTRVDELKVGDTIALSGRTPQRIVGWSEMHGLINGLTYALTLEFGARIESTGGFKFDRVVFDVMTVQES